MIEQCESRKQSCPDEIRFPTLRIVRMENQFGDFMNVELHRLQMPQDQTADQLFAF